MNATMSICAGGTELAINNTGRCCVLKDIDAQSADARELLEDGMLITVTEKNLYEDFYAVDATDTLVGLKNIKEKSSRMESRSNSTASDL
jgi:hypothetical protein